MCFLFVVVDGLAWIGTGTGAVIDAAALGTAMLGAAVAESFSCEL